MRQLRLFLEEVCFNLCLLEEAGTGADNLPEVRVRQELSLGVDGNFADLRVDPPGKPGYFVEVKYGYPRRQLVQALHRKYGRSEKFASTCKVLLVVDTTTHGESWQEIEAEIKAGLQEDLELEVWDESELTSRIHATFGVEVPEISQQGMLNLRWAINDSKGRAAFGEVWDGNSLQHSLLWHFGFLKLRHLRETQGLDADRILPPGLYNNVIVLIADLCSFSSFVRDTRDSNVVRHCLTAFYSKARYSIISSGGMLYLYVGDAVIGLFGLPKPSVASAHAALACAQSLLELGVSVTNHWQRQIDRKQESSGIHIGMTMGDIQIVPLQPYGRSHVGAVSDSINMASRLLGISGPGEITVSNTYFQQLDEADQENFVQVEDVDAKNLGKIIAWKRGEAEKPS